MSSRLLGAAVALVLLAVAWGATVRSSRAPASPEVRVEETTAPARPDLRPAIAQASARTLDALGPAPDRAAVERTLAQLEQQGLARGHVTALEVEPGLDAIEAARGTLGDAAAAELRARFAGRMEALSVRLDPPAAPPTDAPETLLAHAAAETGAARSALVERYLAAVARLPIDEQSLAMARLDAIIASADAAPDPDALRRAAREATTLEERERATAELRELAAARPDLAPRLVP